jgi:hypothetical protein
MGQLRKSPTIITAQTGLTCGTCRKVFDGTYSQAKRALQKSNVYCGKKCRREALRKSTFYTTPIGNKKYEQ